MTRAEIIAEVYLKLHQKNATGNQWLTATAVGRQVDLAYQWVYRMAHLCRRMATLAAVNGQAPYLLPRDLVAVEAVRYGSTSNTPLVETAIVELDDLIDGNWRTATASTQPPYWFMESARSFQLYPAPSVSTATSFYLYGYAIPYQIGGGVTALSRASNVLTVTTSTAHSLRVGETVTLSGCADTTFNTALTVSTVPSAMTFTAAQTAADDTNTTANLAYTGGLLPMLASTDTPALPDDLHDLLAYRAALVLATEVLIDDEHARSFAPIAQAKADELLRALKAQQVSY